MLLLTPDQHKCLSGEQLKAIAPEGTAIVLRDRLLRHENCVGVGETIRSLSELMAYCGGNSLPQLMAHVFAWTDCGAQIALLYGGARKSASNPHAVKIVYLDVEGDYASELPDDSIEGCIGIRLTAPAEGDCEPETTDLLFPLLAERFEDAATWLEREVDANLSDGGALPEDLF